MRRAFAALLLAGLGAGARPPLTSSSGRSQSAQEDGYGSQLLSAVLMNDLDQADAGAIELEIPGLVGALHVVEDKDAGGEEAQGGQEEEDA